MVRPGAETEVIFNVLRRPSVLRNPLHCRVKWFDVFEFQIKSTVDRRAHGCCTRFTILVVSMNTNVTIQRAGLTELFAADRTLERFFAGMNFQMVRKRPSLTERFAAVRASVRLFTCVDFYMIR